VYINYEDTGGSTVRRLTYTLNQPPVAVASVTPYYGPTPLTVQFSSAGTMDPEQQALTYDWDFGDGSPRSSAANPSHVYADVGDITAAGTIIARVFELNPPRPTGSGNWNPEIIRDGDYPPVGNAQPLRQFDTYHAGDQGNSDYIGYSFPTVRQFRSLTFQEGMHFGNGGWFDSFTVQVLVGSTWTNVSGFSIAPAYPFNNDSQNYETYNISFSPISGTAIRIAGNPGGSANFISVGELRVSASLGSSAPITRTAVLTVTDSLNESSTTSVNVYLNNTPPNVTITSPVDGDVYNICQSIAVPLTATISDAEFPQQQLTCRWQTILHHNEHTHPEPIDMNCATTTVLSPHGNTGETYYFEIRLTVTDPMGLSTTRSVDVFPVCCPADWDQSGDVTSQDFFEFIADFFVGNADFNMDGQTTSQDFFDFLGAFFTPC